MIGKRLLALFAGFAAFVALWLCANLLFFGSGAFSEASAQIHLMIMLAIAMAVVVKAATARGSLEDRLQQVIVSMTVTFGTYALVILIGRYFFSRTVIVTIVPLTLVFALLVIWFRGRRNDVRTAVIAPLTPTISPDLSAAEVLHDPQADFRKYDLILVDLHAPVSGDWAQALSRAMLCGCRIRHVQDHLEELSGSVSITHFELEHVPATNFESYIAVKRILDIVGVILLAPLTVPLVALGSLAVLLASGWPIFFVQPRVGLGGAPFRMWKLRTMHNFSPDKPADAAVPGDPRVTAIGRFLRRSRIDELPQLWNVLRGDMSLIGPRPEVVPFHNRYVAVEPKFAYRCLVRPGITGWAQINAPPSATVDEALFKARYDLYYIKRQSLALDLQVGVRTIWTLIHGGGVR